MWAPSIPCLNWETAKGATLTRTHFSSTKAGSKMEGKQERVSFWCAMGVNMQACLRMERSWARGREPTMMAQSILENLSKVRRMATERSLMASEMWEKNTTKETGPWTSEVALVSFSCAMVQCLKETLSIISLRGIARSFSQTRQPTQERSHEESWMESDPWNSPTDSLMRANLKME